MRRVLHELFAYLKLFLILAVVLSVGIILLMNLGRTAEVWLWNRMELPTLWLMGATAAASISLYWVLARVRRVLHDVTAFRRARREAAEAAAQLARARQLAEQEQRIDAKLRQSLAPPTLVDDPSTGGTAGGPPR